MDKKIKSSKTHSLKRQLVRISKVGSKSSGKSPLKLKGRLFFPESRLFLVRPRLADSSLKVIGKPKPQSYYKLPRLKNSYSLSESLKLPCRLPFFGERK